MARREKGRFALTFYVRLIPFDRVDGDSFHLFFMSGYLGE
jgi:hypothetical protein